MSRCHSCPVRPESPRPCLGERHKPACGYVAAGRQEWVAHLIAMAEGRPVADPGRVDVRLAMLADVCAFGSGACGCGSTARDCSRPDRPDKVWRADCLRCQAETPG